MAGNSFPARVKATDVSIPSPDDDLEIAALRPCLLVLLPVGSQVRSGDRVQRVPVPERLLRIERQHFRIPGEGQLKTVNHGHVVPVVEHCVPGEDFPAAVMSVNVKFFVPGMFFCVPNSVSSNVIR